MKFARRKTSSLPFDVLCGLDELTSRSPSLRPSPQGEGELTAAIFRRTPLNHGKKQARASGHPLLGERAGVRGTATSDNQVRSETKRRSDGFTLAEVLAALVFMAILIPVALEGLSIAGRAGEVAARKSEAALVAERILNESVLTTNWNSSVQNGTVRQGYRDFRYTLRSDPWDLDPNQTAMRLLSVEVTFDAQGQDHSVRMSTLVDSSTPLTPTTSQQ